PSVGPGSGDVRLRRGKLSGVSEMYGVDGRACSPADLCQEAMTGTMSSGAGAEPPGDGRRGMFPELVTGSDREALRFGAEALTYRELAQVAGHLADNLRGRTRVAVWATPTIETCVAVVSALVAGVPVVPVNPKIGERELAHIVADSAPDLLLA